MAKVDTVLIASQRLWVDINKNNIQEISIANAGAVKVNFDFALGPSTLADGGDDTGAIYFLKDIVIPVNTTLVLDEQWLKSTFSSGKKIFTNTVVAGKAVRTEMTNPTYLVRTGDVDLNERVNIIILRT